MNGVPNPSGMTVPEGLAKRILPVMTSGAPSSSMSTTWSASGAVKPAPNFVTSGGASIALSPRNWYFVNFMPSVCLYQERPTP